MPLANSSVSIIIPNYNGRGLLEKNLPAVLKAAPAAQIIVVDDASTDDSVAYLHSAHPMVQVIKHQVNQRFAAACNTGVDAASGEIVVLLNSDVSPHPDFLQPLLSPFDDPRVFAVGCKELTTHGREIIESGRAGGAFRRGLAIHWRMRDQHQRSTLWVSGGSGAFRRSLWLELGGMDTLFAPAYEEDRDICYRALKRGYKVMFAPLSRVDHHHETTNQKELGQLVMQAASYKNHLLFVWKNITQPALIRQHFLWLPYHLLVTTLRSHGTFFLGFLWAVTKVPAVSVLRQKEAREGSIQDADILAAYLT